MNRGRRIFSFCFLNSCKFTRRKFSSSVELPFKVKNHTYVNGKTLIDENSWMHNATKDDKRWRDLISFEKKNLKNVSERDVQEEIYRELLDLDKITNHDFVNFPEKIGDYYYYTRLRDGDNFYVYCRSKSKSLDTENLFKQEEVFLDPNEIGSTRGYNYIHINEVKLSHDGKYIAYLIDSTGDENFKMEIKNLLTGQTQAQNIERVYTFDWFGKSSQFIIFTTLDKIMRPNRVHILNTILPSSNDINKQQDAIIYEEKDAAFYVNLYLSKDKRFLVINSASKTSNELRIIDTNFIGSFSSINKSFLSNLEQNMKLVEERTPNHSYYLDSIKNHFFIVTNADGCDEFKLVGADFSKPQRKYWRRIYHRKNIQILDVEVYSKFIAIYESHSGVRKVNVIPFTPNFGELDYSKSFYLPMELFPSVKHDSGKFPVFSIKPGFNHDIDQNYIRIIYSNPVTPDTPYDFNVESKTLTSVLPKSEKFSQSTQFYQLRVPIQNPEPELNHSFIPVTIIHQSNIKLDGSNPVMIIAYGAYGDDICDSDGASFKKTYLPLLNRGWIIAIGIFFLCSGSNFKAGVRGGGELGAKWHKYGNLEFKKNSMIDFETVCRHLIEKKYTKQGNIYAFVSSAGGLLLGGVINMYPKLVTGAIMKVPFVEIVQTLLNKDLPLSEYEYDEYLNPYESSENLSYMLSYDPYMNLQKGDHFPHLLVTASEQDNRVPFYIPIKYIHRMRSLCTNKETRLVLSLGEFGHSGDGSHYNYLRQTAFEYGFLIQMHKLKNKMM